MPRPYIGPRVNLCVPAELVDKIEEHAKLAKVTFNTAARRVLYVGLAHLDAPDTPPIGEKPWNSTP